MRHRARLGGLGHVGGARVINRGLSPIVKILLTGRTSMTKKFSPIDFHGKVLFHIGPHKTGSTSIQHFMDANYKSLKKQDILYPKSGRIDNKGTVTSLHHPLIKSFFEKDQIDTETQIQNLKDEIESSGAKVVIISSEVL